MEKQDPAVTETIPLNRWVWLVVVCAIGAIGWFAFHPGNSTDFSFHLGYNVWVSLLVWWVFTATAFGKRYKGGRTVAFFSVYLSFVLAGWAGNKYHEAKFQREARIAAPGLRTLMDQVYNQSKNPMGPKAPIDTTVKASGDVGELERWLKSSMSKMAQAHAAYIEEVKEIGSEGLMDYGRIQSMGDLDRRIEIARSLQRCSARYKDKILELVATLRTDAENLNLDENSRRSLLRGFDRSANETDLRAAADLDRQIFVQVENQLRVLKRSYGAWKVVNGQLMFQRNSDMLQFNEAGMKIQQLQAKEEEVREAGKKKMEAGIKAFEDP